MTAIGLPADRRPLTLDSPAWYRSRRAQAVGVGLLAAVVAQVAASGSTVFPASWDIGLSEPISDFQGWVQRNRDTNFFLAHVLRPMGDFVLSFYEFLRDGLLGLPWFWLPLLVFIVVARSGRWVQAAVAATGLLFVEFAGFHEAGMETVALMLICVVLSVVIGAPLGIWAGLNPTVERRLRPVLDALQSLPTTIYLVPAVLFFGVLQTPAAVATIAFAVPPMVRIAALGIRQVPEASVEAGRIFGSNRWQLLWKVQAPQAVRSFITGINQTIMMCLGMVVIGSLVGAGGLGNELIQTLRLRSPGRGVIVGLAVFGVAVAFDRMSRSLLDRRAMLPIPARTYWGGAAAVLIVALILGRLLTKEVPWVFDQGIADPVDRFTTWFRDTFRSQLEAGNDFVVREIVIRLRDWTGYRAANATGSDVKGLFWPIMIGQTAAAAWLVKGWRLAVFCVGGLIAVGLLGMWAPSLETLAQLVVSVVIAIAVAVPLGIFVGRRPRAEAALDPLLDAMQTFPALIYAIPFVMIFAVGYVPPILATVIYAIPPGVRLTALAIKQVSGETLEAATTFGASSRQRLWGVQVPLALKGIGLGINQVVMMAVSMVIIAGLIGGGGLGFLAIDSLIRQDTGQGIEVGIALLVMAIILDRLTEGLAQRLDPANR